MNPVRGFLFAMLIALDHDIALKVYRATGATPMAEGNNLWITNGRDYRIFLAMFPYYAPSYTFEFDK